MDKNLVNIDDLVRQRLMGGEEKERAGAWLRMSELLEEEMPKARPAAFPWRRIFGAGAILLLLGSLSLGGYEMNAYMHRGNTDASNTAMIAAAPNGTSAGANTNSNATTTVASSNPDNTAATANNTTADNNTNNNTSSNNVAGQPVNHQSANSSIKNHTASGNINTTSTVAGTTTKANTTGSTASTNNTNTSKIGAINNTPGKQSPKHAHKHVSATAGEQAVAAEGTAKVAPGTANTDNSINERNSKAIAAKTAKHLNTTGTNAATPAPAKSDVAVNAPEKTTVAGNTGSEAGATTALAGANKPHHTKKAHNGTAKTTTITGSGMVLSSSAPKAGVGTANVVKTSKPATGVPAKNTVGAAVANNNTGTAKANGLVKTHKRTTATTAKTTNGTNAVGSNVAVAKSNTIAKVAKKTVTNTGVAKKNDNATAVVTKKINGKRTAKKTAGNTVTANDNDDATADVAAAPQREQRTIPRMVVQERLMRTTPFDATYHLDTISFGSIVEEFDQPNVFGAKPKSNGKANGELASNDQPDNAQPSKPAKQSSDENSADMKDKTKNQKSLGQRTVENLSAAFNDIKTHAGNAQFAAGLTGGINGTFLGPNNFKGFQFGVTGKFTFSDAVAIMGELKYFHRINNGYTLNDNYYDYTAVSGGYSKQLVEESYGISTLHSLELPITVRYCISGFNFFIGGNFAYMFAINTGEYPTTPTGVTPVFSQTMGTDNAPKVKANDFNSRFGVGYTFGASYQLSPKVTLDLREVQTFWDNAKTDGAKYISSQLYKSPSFQLSLGYRFGGGKKDKE